VVNKGYLLAVIWMTKDDEERDLDFGKKKYVTKKKTKRK
jgi:hypothetical protein